MLWFVINRAFFIIKITMLHRLKIILFSIFLLVAGTFFVGSEVMAQAPGPAQVDLGLQFAQETGLTTTDIRVVIANIIRVAFGLLGIVAVGVILYGGFIWMTSGGDRSKIESAKKILINGVIGLVIILSAFGITEFIIRTVLGQSGSGSGSSTSSSSGAKGGGGFGGGALGKVISAHYPDRGATDVARNTKIIVTFVEKVKKSTIFDTSKKNAVNLNFANVKIYPIADAKAGGLPPADSKLLKNVTVSTIDDLTYTFSFGSNYLGSPSQKVGYAVYLGPGIEKSNGQSVFGGPGGSYAWQFETGTTIDLTPPQVESVSPTDPQGCPGDIKKCTPRNEVIQIHFNEAIDPTTVTGIVPGFNFISSTPQVAGEFLLTNQYRTVIFIPKSGCGGISKNSCGDPVFCLPGKTKIKMNIAAAKLDPKQKGTAQASLPYTGVVDVAGNSLDAQTGPSAKLTKPNVPDGIAQGPPVDDYKWEFTTSDTVDLKPPKIVSMSPDVNESKVKIDKDVQVLFDKIMMASSLFGGVQFFYGESTKPNQRIPWAGAQSTILGRDKSGTVNPKAVKWFHYDNLLGSTKQKTYYYYPIIYSSIKDSRQNCFNPVEGPQTTKGSKKCEDVGNNWKLGSSVGAYPYECNLAK